MLTLRKWASALLRKMSIQQQLAVTYLVIILVPLILLSLLSYHLSAKSIMQETENNNSFLLSAISGNINSLFDEVKMKSHHVSLLLAGGELDPEHFRQYFFHILDTEDHYMSIRIYDNEGNLLAAIAKRPNKAFSYTSRADAQWRERMREHRWSESGNDLLVTVHQPDTNGLYSFISAAAIHDPFTGELIGYVSMEQRLNAFAINFKEIEYRSGGIIQVIQPDGTLLYHTNNAKIGEMADARLLEQIGGMGAGTFTDDTGGRTILTTFNKIADGNLTVVGSVPLDVLTRDIRDLRDVTLIVLIMAIVLVVLLTIQLSSFMAIPIKKLSNMMAEVERGKFDVVAPVMNTNREIRQLSQSFKTMVDRLKRLIEIQFKTELYRKEAELKALIMQINPHFLYNTLEVINGIADDEGVYQISEMTQALSKMLRYNLDFRREQVQIADELENIRHYVLIMKSRFEDRLEVEWDADPAVNPYLITKTVLQPLLENAIKHGIERKLGKGWIKITARKLGEEILIRIADNGIGFDAGKLEEFKRFKNRSTDSFFDVSTSSSLGLKNVYTRLRMFFGQNLHFDIDSVSGEGTTLTIRFPALLNKTKDNGPGDEIDA